MSADIAERLADLNPYEFFGFASYLEGRTNGVGTNFGEFKRHKTLGHARSAIANWSGRNGARRLYAWDTELEQWSELPPAAT